MIFSAVIILSRRATGRRAVPEPYAVGQCPNPVPPGWIIIQRRPTRSNIFRKHAIVYIDIRRIQPAITPSNRLENHFVVPRNGAGDRWSPLRILKSNTPFRRHWRLKHTKKLPRKNRRSFEITRYCSIYLRISSMGGISRKSNTVLSVSHSS